MKIIILAGGLGTRFGDMTKLVPKPMLKIGKYPILLHLINNFISQGYKDFVVCTGYKHDYIDAYFKQNTKEIDKNLYLYKDSNVQLKFTGVNTNTGGRLFKIKDMIDSKCLITYGDGLSNIKVKNIDKLNNLKDTLLTISVTNAQSRFGMVEVNNGMVVNFEEKGKLEELINMGFMLAKPEFFNIVKKNDVLETSTIKKLLKMNQLSAYHHKGTFFPIDTQRDLKNINTIYKKGKKFW